jgi:hypothetical protein
VYVIPPRKKILGNGTSVKNAVGLSWGASHLIFDRQNPVNAKRTKTNVEIEFMQLWIVKQINKDHSIVLHRVPLPEFEEKNYYRTITSWDCFRINNAKQIHKNLKRFGFSLHPRDEFDYKLDKELCAKFREHSISDTPTVVEHKDICAFYEYVGYDRKRRGFVVKVR